MRTSDRCLLNDGTPLTLRPIEAADGSVLAALFDGLSPHDRHLRFHGAFRVTSAAHIAQLTQVDPNRSLALVATASLRGRELLVAEARWVIDDSGQDAEMALLVDAPWRQRGIGARLLAALRRGAAARGLRQLYGHVLAINPAMLALARSQGFRCAPDADDARLQRVSANLPHRAAEQDGPVSAGMAMRSTVEMSACVDSV